MSPALSRTCAVGAAIGALALLPAAASAEGGPRADGGGAGAAPARVAVRLRRAERALGRAEDHATDGESAAAVKALGAVRSNLAAALKAAGRRVGTDAGPRSLGALARVQDHVAQSTASLFDGADDDLTAGLADTLKAALDGHDAVVTDIAALSADDQADYVGVVDDIVDQADEEVDAFNEGVSDDTLTAAGKSAEQDAATQAGKTSTAAGALSDTADAADASGDGDYPGDPGAGGPRGDCPHGGS